MSVIGEAALSVFFEMLFEKIASSDLFKFVSENEVLFEINKWKEMLENVREVLDDAEEKQMNNKSVKDWLSDLQDLAYEVEDILDEFATESLRPKLEEDPQLSVRKIRKLIPNFFTSLNPRAFMFNSKMDSKIKEITERLQAISAKKNELDFTRIVAGSSSKAWQRLPSTCLPDELKVYGRDEDKRKILDLILRNDATADAKVEVLPIVGMGGLGKTTLARLVYNDEFLQQQHFDIKAWVSVCDDFDILRITKGILESITLKPCDLKELNQVQLELRKELAGKRFLIVLDDVWTERYEDWIALRPPFMDGAVGCRIIVTTRSMIVARNMGTIEQYILKSISDDDCWMLFRSHAFENRGNVTVKNQDIIRQKVLSRCAGLPLAARTLGGLLRSKPRDRWEEILNSKLWISEDGNSSILPVLKLSYYHLPSYLKRCFSYCAIFPKDYEFAEMEVVLLWMAEGLILKVEEKQAEDVGREYFRDLLSRSFFQESSSGGSKFVMHDLVNDLAQTIAGETCFRLEDSKQFRRDRARHSSYICSRYDGIEKFQPFQEMPCLRTFLPLSLGEITFNINHLTSDVLSNLLPKLESLRVLSLKGYDIYELPESIGDLKHLRYLDLSFTCVISLPESTSSLFNLQTLNLHGCKYLKKLPSRIEKLINLRHLNIEGVCLKDGLPLGVKELASLRTLSEFSVGGAASLTSLKKLKFLRGNLRIWRLENVSDALDGREAKLKEKKDLRALSLEWSNSVNGVRKDERFDRELLDGLEPPVELERLQVWSYRGIEFPAWMGDPSFNNLVSLQLWFCSKCNFMPELGLLKSLKNLMIKGMCSVKRIGGEFYGEGCSHPFPSLETLWFENMEEWVEWDQCGFEFACLREITVWNCPKLLGRLPNSLSKLKTLRINSCDKLIISLPSLPMVSQLIIRNCKEVDLRNMVEFGSPYLVILDDISKVTFETERLIMEKLMKAKVLSLNRDFVFDSHHQLLNFGEKMTKEKERMIQLEALELRNTESFFQQAVSKYSNIFSSLRHLTVSGCKKLVSFQGLSFPSTLQVIRIRQCNALVSLPNAISLQDLEIDSCDSLISIGRSQISSTLKRLVISYCKNLQYLHVDKVHGSSSESFINLELLRVENCPSLVSLSSSLTPSLQRLEIKDCSKLESIAETFSSTSTSSSRLEYILIEDCDNLRYLPKDIYKLIHLNEIHIYTCQSLVSFPEGGLPVSCHLKIFKIHNCHKLETLPDNIHKITSLEEFVIDACILNFPKEGFPTKLTTLVIFNLINCKQLFEWGLHKLTSLTNLSIEGGFNLSFPCEDTGMGLPPSLKNLTILDFPKLKYLSTKGFQNLIYLQSLSLAACPLLASFPKGGFTHSLRRLYINSCPLLKQRCLKDKGQEWFKISHVPCVRIDGRSAFHPHK